MKDHFVTLAGYNAWANAKLFEAVALLPEEDLQRDIGIYAGSIIGLLNHVLVVDRLWMVQLNGDGDPPDSEDDVLFEDFADLREARVREDQRIEAFTERLEEPDFHALVRYHTVRQPLVEAQSIAAVLAHLFNHQTHHRGEITVGLSVLGVAVPDFDLATYRAARAPVAMGRVKRVA